MASMEFVSGSRSTAGETTASKTAAGGYRVEARIPVSAVR